MVKKLSAVIALIVVSASASAQEVKEAQIKPDAMVYKDNPFLPKSQTSLLFGDPKKVGDVIVQRIKLPANYKIPPHTHPYIEVVTVISGTINFSRGEKFDTTKTEFLPTGSVILTPAKSPHFGWTGDEGAVIQAQFIGPGGFDLVNPADDPRKKTD